MLWSKHGWEVEYTDEFEIWWMTLTEPERASIAAVVELLEAKGPGLTRPHVDTLAKDSKYSNMKELRVQHSGRPYRIIFAFDPRQSAILLVGGVKSGKGWTAKMIAMAEKVYSQYLREIKKEGLI
jgi:hypothetical protein